jgi:hypothetical protein
MSEEAVAKLKNVWAYRIYFVICSVTKLYIDKGVDDVIQALRGLILCAG